MGPPPTADWLRTYEREFGNLRAALDWAFSKEGDGAVGATLTAAAAPIWFHLSLLDEGLSRVEYAISWLKDQPTPDRRLMMRLYAISGWPRMRAIKGSGAAAWREVLALAVELDDADYQLRAIWALWLDRINNSEAAESLVLADRFTVVAERSGDFRRSAGRAADARKVLALLGGLRRITPTDRADAGVLRATAAAVACRLFPTRSTTDSTDHLGSGALASRPC